MLNSFVKLLYLWNMRNPKGYVLFISALFLLVGSIGVNVFLHTCEEDGTFVSYFVPADEDQHCEKAHQDKPECCNTGETTEDDCCGDELKHYQVKLDYFQKISTPFIPVDLVPEPVWVANMVLSDEDLVVSNYANPPPKKRSVERSLSQIWII